MSMAYLDPGNLEADLQSGAYTRYQLLYVVLLSTALGGLYQVLAARLGPAPAATWPSYAVPSTPGRGLRALGHDGAGHHRQRHPGGAGLGRGLRAALRAAAVARLPAHGARHLHVPGAAPSRGPGRPLPRDVLPLAHRHNVRVLLRRLHYERPGRGGDRQGVVEPRLDKQNIMQAVGMLGAIIMPHNIFLHSALVQERQIDTKSTRKVKEANFYFSLEAAMALFVSF